MRPINNFMLLQVTDKSNIILPLTLPSPGVNPITHPKLWDRGSGELSGVAVDRNLISIDLRKVLFATGLELDYVMAFSWIGNRVGQQTPWHCDGRSYRERPQLCSVNWHWNPGTCIEIANEWDDGQSDPTNYAWRVWDNLPVKESLSIYDQGPFLMDIQWPHRVNLFDFPERKSLVLRFKNNPSFNEVSDKMRNAGLINEV